MQWFLQQLIVNIDFHLSVLVNHLMGVISLLDGCFDIFQEIACYIRYIIVFVFQQDHPSTSVHSGEERRNVY